MHLNLTLFNLEHLSQIFLKIIRQHDERSQSWLWAQSKTTIFSLIWWRVPSDTGMSSQLILSPTALIPGLSWLLPHSLH